MTPKDKRYDYDGVYFTMGPISINQFAEFSKHGLGAIRLFQCIRTLQGLVYGGKGTPRDWVKVDNKNSYRWFGLSQSTKWRVIAKLKKAKLIEVRGAKGRAPRIRIVEPDKKLN